MKNNILAEIISIGSELTEGRIINTNAVFIARKLSFMGIKVSSIATISDSTARIIEMMEASLSDIVILTGGLGATHDDITKKAIFSFASKHIVNFPSEKHWRSCLKKYKSSPANSEYFVCKNVFLLKNNAGSAPGFCIQIKNRSFFILPGVPTEAECMFTQEVCHHLQKIQINKIKSYIFRTVGLGEFKIQKKLSKTAWQEQCEMSILPKLGYVDVIIKSDKNVDVLLDNFRSILMDNLYAEEEVSLEEVIANQLFDQKKTIAVAESCSGGYASHLLTNIPGSSEYFKYGVTSYSNESKIQILGVPENIIAKYGAVSKECALEMAKGVRSIANVDIGIATTGISGPTGETLDKPLGLLFVAYNDGRRSLVEKKIYKRPRIAHKKFSANFALQLLWRCLKNA